MEISFLGEWGEKISGLMTKGINFLGELGINITDAQGKIVNLVLILVLLYIVIKVIEIPKRLIKWGIIILLGVLALSIVFSFFS